MIHPEDAELAEAMQLGMSEGDVQVVTGDDVLDELANISAGKAQLVAAAVASAEGKTAAELLDAVADVFGLTGEKLWEEIQARRQGLAEGNDMEPIV